MFRIKVCAPSRPITEQEAAQVAAISGLIPGSSVSFHPQCFASVGHFAGTDAQRLEAFADCANDPAFDAVWFARGGYGAGRIAGDLVDRLGTIAGNKHYLGYSDGGMLLGTLYRAGIGKVVHAPMPADLRREQGELAIRRVLEWASGSTSGVEPIDDGYPRAAFNLMTLAMLCGTDLMPDLTGHVVMVEEVSEHLYAVDRLLAHVTRCLKGIAGLRLGRVSDVPENDVDFGATPAQMAQHWCAKAGIRYMGSADIGHDIDNKIVPFGVSGGPTGA